MRKSTEELEKINTKNLLRYYKAERNRMFNRGYRYMVINSDENLNPIMGWNNIPNSESFYDDINYLEKIKTILNTREHIIK